MALLPGILVFGTMATLLVVLIGKALRKGASGTKIMLLGISITLFGGIIAVDPNSSLGGVEYLIALAGLILSIIGFGKED